MLRFQSALASVVGAGLVLPVFLGQGELATLEDALSGTLRALEVLDGIEQRFLEDPASALGLLLAATEPAPEGDPRANDERLETLRDEVNLLQMELDALESPSPAGTGAIAAPEVLSRRAGVPGGVTTGLDDSLRALLSQDLERPSLQGTRPEAPSPTGTRAGAAPASAAAEAPAYSADPLRHGIACFRAGRHAEALELLAELPDDAHALYWTARTLERLGRLDEALETLERALARGAGELEAERVQSELEFLRWKRDFLRNRAASGGEVPR